MSMEETELTLHFPCERPLKESEKDELTSELMSAFNSVGVYDVKVKESHYLTELAAPGISEWVLRIIAAASHIINIAKAVRNFLKRRKNIKEIYLETESFRMVVKGEMSDEEIIRIIREARR